jgi:hypothetical protein
VVSLGATFDFVAIFLLNGFHLGKNKRRWPSLVQLGSTFLEEVWMGRITCIP